jgi:predicted O-methyltransferase YrrM
VVTANYIFTHNDFNHAYDKGNKANGGAKSNIEWLVNYYGVPSTIIEVGVFEGGTTFWLSEVLTPHNKNLKIYAIDPHVGSTDMDEDPDAVQKNFAHNVSVCTYQNVEYIRKHSEDGLIDLINKGVQAELIYIDGDHKANAVLTDLVLSWKLLKKGGVILCDDAVHWQYKDENGMKAAQMSPRMAVEFFIQCHWHELHLIKTQDSWQTAFQKL